MTECCCWHHKGTIFQANHNTSGAAYISSTVVVDTTKVRFFKQITTSAESHLYVLSLLLTPQRYDFSSKSQHSARYCSIWIGCCWHHKGTIFQANHNYFCKKGIKGGVVVDTTKVRFFKQITTCWRDCCYSTSCCWHHKGTIFQANHNKKHCKMKVKSVVVDTTKVRFFKQITTIRLNKPTQIVLLLTPQRYDFSSKSQRKCTLLH